MDENSMKYYLVKFCDDSLCEANLYGIRFLTEEDKKLFEGLSEDVFPLKYEYGGNEDIYYRNLKEFNNCYHWIEIIEQEYISNFNKKFDIEFGYFFYPNFENLNNYYTETLITLISELIGMPNLSISFNTRISGVIYQDKGVPNYDFWEFGSLKEALDKVRYIKNKHIL